MTRVKRWSAGALPQAGFGGSLQPKLAPTKRVLPSVSSPSTPLLVAEALKEGGSASGWMGEHPAAAWEARSSGIHSPRAPHKHCGRQQRRQRKTEQDPRLCSSALQSRTISDAEPRPESSSCAQGVRPAKSRTAPGRQGGGLRSPQRWRAASTSTHQRGNPMRSAAQSWPCAKVRRRGTFPALHDVLSCAAGES